MVRGIRVASVDDASAVADFFTSVYEGEHGAGAAAALQMRERTLAVLFPVEGERPEVFVYDAGEAGIQGVTAVRAEPPLGEAELITVQVFDTVQGKGIAQTLLRRAIDHVRASGVATLHTAVDAADVRARGFLRREGFTVTLPEGGVPDEQDALVRYELTWESPAS